MWVIIIYENIVKAKMSLMDLTNSKHFGVHRNSSYEPGFDIRMIKLIIKSEWYNQMYIDFKWCVS